MTLKAISLHQPYATLAALGFKLFETRGWATPYRGPLLICSTASTPGRVWRPAVARPEVAEAWAEAARRMPSWANGAMPHGVALAIVDLTACSEMALRPDLAGWQGSVWADARERAFGDWRPGRFAWRLESPRPLMRPVPVIGRQRLWNPPPGVVRAVEDALAWAVPA